MIKRFKIVETNIPNIGFTHFTCNTKISTHSQILENEEPYRCAMFDGLRVKLIQEDKYIIGIIHG